MACTRPQNSKVRTSHPMVNRVMGKAWVVRWIMSGNSEERGSSMSDRSHRLRTSFTNWKPTIAASGCGCELRVVERKPHDYSVTTSACSSLVRPKCVFCASSPGSRIPTQSQPTLGSRPSNRPTIEQICTSRRPKKGRILLLACASALRV